MYIYIHIYSDIFFFYLMYLFLFSEEVEQVEKQKETVQKTLRKRNLVFDEEHFQDAFLRCIICRDVFNESSRAPKTLPCQHTFCLHCFLEMFRVEGEYRQSLTSAFRGMPRAVKIQCPTCRDSIIASEDDLRRLPNDNTILELLRFVQETGITDIAYCAKHQLQPLNFFCEQCVTAVCCDCTVLDHKEKNGHVVMSMDEALKKYTPVIDSSINEMESRRQQFKEKRMEVSKRLEEVRYMEQRVSSGIKKTFQMIRDVIKEREQMLLNMSEREVEKKRSDLQENLNHIKEKEENMMSQIKILETAKEEKDIQYMFNVYNMAQDSLVESMDLPYRVDDDFGLSFNFEEDKMASLGSELKDFGNLVVGESNMTVMGMSKPESGRW